MKNELIFSGLKVVGSNAGRNEIYFFAKFQNSVVFFCRIITNFSGFLLEKISSSCIQTGKPAILAQTP